MFAEVQPVRAAPPTTGLVASAVQPRDDVRWESGFSWLPERCITHQGFSPCGTLDGEPDESPASVAHYLPPGFRVRDICTTLDGARNADRVRRQAEAVTSFIVARELWTGTLTQADPGTVDGSPYVNPFLADGNATEVAAPADLTMAIATLEQEARVAANGQQVFIHLPMGMLPPVSNVRRVGNVLYTANDSVLVADAGYTGTGAPVAGTAEVQTVTITGGPTGGNFQLTFDGQTTIAIGYNSPAADVQDALNALSNLSGVTVSGAGGGPYTVTFPVAMGNVPEMTGDGSGLTGGAAPAVAVATTTPGVAPSTEAGTWLYATGPVQVRLSPVEIIDDAAQTVDRTTNRQEIWAERVFAATFDPCVHLAMNVAAP